MEERQKRQPAYIVSIEDLSKGIYVKTEGWEPNFIKTEWGLRVSRINIIGTIIEKDQQGVTIDDGTGKIEVRSFEPFEAFDRLSPGECVILIGKVRKFNEEIYISPEICKKIDPKWANWKREELERTKKLFAEGKIVQEIKKEEVKFESGNEINEEIEVQKEASLFEKLLEYIEKQDNGDGVTKAMITNGFDEPIDDVIRTLIMEGDIFEIKPDTFKVLK
jgi:RPA family protein